MNIDWSAPDWLDQLIALKSTDPKFKLKPCPDFDLLQSQKANELVAKGRK